MVDISLHDVVKTFDGHEGVVAMIEHRPFGTIAYIREKNGQIYDYPVKDIVEIKATGLSIQPTEKAKE